MTLAAALPRCPHLSDQLRLLVTSDDAVLANVIYGYTVVKNKRNP